MTANNSSNSDKKGIQPNEPLKEHLDDARIALHEKMRTLQQGINGGVGPMLSALDAHEVNKQIAVVEAWIDAYTLEYQHVIALNDELHAQRDEYKCKLESPKRLFNRTLSSDNDDDDNPDAAPTNAPRKRGK